MKMKRNKKNLLIGNSPASVLYIDIAALLIAVFSEQMLHDLVIVMGINTDVIYLLFTKGQCFSQYAFALYEPVAVRHIELP